MIRVGVIGAGNMGSQHLRVFGDLASRCEVVGFAEADPHRREALQRARRVEPFPDFGSMIEKTKPDAVTIALPNELHASAAVECLKRGIDVLVEKPIAMDMDGATAMVEAARESGRLLMVGHVERFNPAVQFIRKYVSDGKLGEVYYLTSRRLGVYPARHDGSQEYGVSLDLAIHDVDAMRFIMNRQAVRVHRDSIRKVSKMDDYVAITMRLGEAVGLVEASWLSPYKIRQLIVNGKEGIGVLDYMAQTVEVISDYKEKPEYAGYRDFIDFEYEITKPAIRKQEPLRQELDHFLECVSTGAQTISDGENGLENLRLVL